MTATTAPPTAAGRILDDEASLLVLIERVVRKTVNVEAIVVRESGENTVVGGLVVAIAG